MNLNFGQIPPLTTVLAALKHLQENDVSTFFSVAIDLMLFRTADKEVIHNIFNDFEFRPYWTTNNRVSCHERLKITP